MFWTIKKPIKNKYNKISNNKMRIKIEFRGKASINNKLILKNEIIRLSYSVNSVKKKN